MTTWIRSFSALLSSATVLSLAAACNSYPTGSRAVRPSLSVNISTQAWPDATVRPDSLAVITAVRNEGTGSLALDGSPDFSVVTQVVRSVMTGDTVWISPRPPILPTGRSSIGPQEEFRVTNRWDLRHWLTRQPVPAGEYLVLGEYRFAPRDGEGFRVTARPITVRLR